MLEALIIPLPQHLTQLTVLLTPVGTTWANPFDKETLCWRLQQSNFQSEGLTQFDLHRWQIW
jgi:hypothetical protein